MKRYYLKIFNLKEIIFKSESNDVHSLKILARNKIFETSEGVYLYLGIKEVQIKIYDRKRRRDIII